jgi:hypothetical protein
VGGLRPIEGELLIWPSKFPNQPQQKLEQTGGGPERSREQGRHYQSRVETYVHTRHRAVDNQPTDHRQIDSDEHPDEASAHFSPFLTRCARPTFKTESGESIRGSVGIVMNPAGLP